MGVVRRLEFLYIEDERAVRETLRSLRNVGRGCFFSDVINVAIEVFSVFKSVCTVALAGNSLPPWRDARSAA